MNTSPNTNIDITCHHPNWYQTIPNIDSIINTACTQALIQTQTIQPTELSILLTDNTEIQQLNKQYRQQNKPTNVLAFPTNETIENRLILGDIILALQTIMNESDQQNKTPEDHCCHLLIHGTLHLLGYDHITPSQASIMEKIEIQTLKVMGKSNPYA